MPQSYSARCTDDAGAQVLEITPRDGAPALTPRPLPTWGLHFVDGNIALGNLIGLVRRQAAEYTARR